MSDLSDNLKVSSGFPHDYLMIFVFILISWILDGFGYKNELSAYHVKIRVVGGSFDKHDTLNEVSLC